jgi:hypothetical protein
MSAFDDTVKALSQMVDGKDDFIMLISSSKKDGVMVKYKFLSDREMFLLKYSKVI